ncbi:MAG: formyltransferase family protein [Pseudomonadota bacterium]|nr:formyltransferase family protein [Pseudomonadota bacterium]
MPEEIILLTGEAEAPHLASVLQNYRPGLSVFISQSLDQVEATCRAPEPAGGSRRLIAYCTSVIVPAAVIDAMSGPAYNFHPGPPTYPGARAASFAIYESVGRFGATAHVMLEKVDAGPIVGVDWFDVPEGIKFMDLEIMAYKALFTLFKRLARHLATNDAPLPEISAQWTGRKTTEQDFKTMQILVADMSEDEIRLRYRAFG